MIRKMCKGIYLCLMLLMVAGIFCFLPIKNDFAKADSSIPTEKSSETNSTTTSTEIESDTLWVNEMAISDPKTETIFGHNGVYKITSAAELAWVAYKVNQGELDENTVAYLSSDIDLNGSLWTPIGTDSNPFKGVFYGNGHKISNVIIDDVAISSSSTSVGVFGATSGATIADVRLAGIQRVNSTKANVGALVGSSTSSYIISCFDELDSRLWINSSDVQSAYKTVGEASDSYFYYGATYYTYTTSPSITNIGATTQDTVKAKVTLPTGFTEGYVITYSLPNANWSFMQNGSAYWAKSYLRVLVNADGSVSKPSGVKANLFEGKGPVLRINASTSDVYVLRKGYKATIPSVTSSLSFSTHLIYNITETSTNLTMTFDQNYGGRKVQVTDFPYDSTFYDYFSTGTNASIKTRLGYTPSKLTRVQNSTEVNFTSNSDYKKCYPQSEAADTYQFTWAWDGKATRTFNVALAYASDEGGILTTNYSSSNQAALKTAFVSSVGTNMGTSTSTTAAYTTTGTFSNDSYSFTIKLNAGYKIATAGETTAIGSVTQNKAGKTSGVYQNFTAVSGEGKNYAVANGSVSPSSFNNDFYNPVSVNFTWENEEEWTAAKDATEGASVGSSIEKEYTITVTNIVGSGGSIYVVVERDMIDVDLTPVYVRTSDTTKYSVSVYTGTSTTNTNLFYLNSKSTFSGTFSSGTKVTLYVRSGESVNIKYTIADTEADYFVDFVSYNVTASHTPSGTSYGTNYKTETVAMSTISYQGYVRLYLNSLYTSVKINYYKNGTETEISSTTDLDGVKTLINSSGAFGIVNSEVVPVNATGNDIIRVTKSGKYELAKISINGTNYTTISQESNRRVAYVSLSGTNKFTQLHGKETTALYTIKVYLSERSYNVNINYIFHNSGDSTGASNQTVKAGDLSKFFTSPTTSLTGKKQGDTCAITFTLKTLGNNIVAYEKADKIEDDGEVKYTESNITAGGTAYSKAGDITKSNTGLAYTLSFKMGSYVDSNQSMTVNVYFTYKTVSLQVNQLVDNTTSHAKLQDLSPVETVGTYSFVYDGSTGAVSINSSSLGTINIPIQYYLVGWYLKNGETVITLTGETGYNDITTKAQHIAENAADGVFSFAAIVESRTVSLTYAPGAQGSGKLYLNTSKTYALSDAGTEAITEDKRVSINSSYKYGGNQTISYNVFFNLGYKTNTYKVLYNTTSELFSTSSTTFTISADNWKKLFGSTGTKLTSNLEAWSSFVTSGTKTAQAVVLQSQWTLIQFSLSIDATTTGNIKLGDSISYTTDDSARNGKATYKVGAQTNLAGSTKNGYVVTGYIVEQASKSSKLTGAQAFNATFLGGIINTGWYKDTTYSTYTIKITTQRAPAAFKVYILQNASYYTLTWTESKDTGNWGQSESNLISINATFDSPIQNLVNAINAGALTIQRTGYSLNLSGDKSAIASYKDAFAVAESATSAVQNSKYDITAKFSNIKDIYLVPRWKKDANSVQATIKFTDGASGAKFRLLTAHDIANGYLSGAVVTDSVASKKTIQKNGDQVSSFKFVLSGAGSKEVALDNFNIEGLAKAGSYNLKFVVTVKDSLSLLDGGITYETTSSSTLAFTMEKNALYFYNNNLHKIFTNSTDWLAGSANQFGKFMYRYGWDGSDLSSESSKTSLGNVDKYFEGFQVDGDFYAGTGKALKMNFKNGTETGTAIKMDTELLSNITKTGEIISVIVNSTNSSSTLTIDKAVYVISFTSGSAFYIEGVQALVHSNVTGAKTQFYADSTNKKFPFTYTYSKILLVKNAQPKAYTGKENPSEDSKNFVVEGLKIDGFDDTKMKANFDWSISTKSTFTLLSTANALTLDYSAGFLIAQNGALPLNIATSYNGQQFNVLINSLSVNSSAKSQSYIEQGSVFEGNTILFTYLGYNTPNLKLIINKEALNTYELNITLEVAMPSDHSEYRNILKLISTEKSTSTSTLAKKFDEQLFTSFTSVVTPTAGDTNAQYYIILTDAAKINLNYNHGKNPVLAEKETIYVSQSTGAFGVTNPSSPYLDYFTFNGYDASPQSNTLTMKALTSENKYSFETASASTTIELTAKWNFVKFGYTLKNNKVSFQASITGGILNLSDVAEITEPTGLITERTYVLTHKDKSQYTFNADAENKFTIKDERGFIFSGMGGTYSLKVILTYEDDFGKQSPSQSLDLTININTNIIDFEFVGENPIYNNSERESTLNLQVNYNKGTDSAKVENPTIQVLKTAAPKTYFFNVAVSGKATTIKDAGEYTITGTISEEYKDVYLFKGNQETYSITINIDPYTIVLKDYVEQGKLNLSKLFGVTDDPNSIPAPLTINSETVTLIFTRLTGEEIGDYLLTFKEIKDEGSNRNNYTVDQNEFVHNFKIVAPTGENLKVRFTEQIKFTYNGYRPEKPVVSYDKVAKTFKLTFTAGGKEVSATFELFYQGEGVGGLQDVFIPDNDDLREDYASYIILKSDEAQRKAGTYTITAEFIDGLTDRLGWQGIEIVKNGNEKILIEKKDLKIKSIEKVFNNKFDLLYNNQDDSKNTATIIFDETDGLALESDTVQISGEVKDRNVGNKEIKSKSLKLDDNVGDNGSYKLVYDETLQVQIIADTTTSIDFELNKTSLVYGQIKKTTTIKEAVELIGMTYSVENLDFVVTSIIYTSQPESDYSKGEWLKVNTYQIQIEISSKNYTFGQERKAIGESYKNTYTTKSLKITKKEITIESTDNDITKKYDGNDKILADFLNQLVGAPGGYYSSSGICDGDEIKVVGGTYIDKLIDINKKVINKLEYATDDDHENYSINLNVKGYIKNVELTLKKNGKSQAFVDAIEGEKKFGNAGDIKVTYKGDIELYISDINNKANYMTRVGYTQIGFSYKGKSLGGDTPLPEMTSAEKEELLQKNVDGEEIILDAIWEQDTYTVTLAYNNAAVDIDGKNTDSFTIKYFDETKDFTIEAIQGYKFTGVTAEEGTEELPVIASPVGQTGLKQGKIHIEKVRRDVRVTLITEEISVKININYNIPTTGSYTVITETEGWEKLPRTLTYLQLLGGDLPILRLNKGYKFDYWSMGEDTANTTKNQGENIWLRIDGANIDRDNTIEGITFVAHWTEDYVDLKITGDHMSVVVKVDGKNIDAQADDPTLYKVFYTKPVSIEITADEFYKWVSYDLETADDRGDSADDINKRIGKITIQEARETITVNIVTEVIKINFKPTYTTPIATSIELDNQPESVVFDVEKFGADATFDTIFGNKFYQPQAYTYKHTGWIYNKTAEFNRTDNVREIIKSKLGGVPNEDCTGSKSLTLDAKFEGEEYTVTFTTSEGSFTGKYSGTTAVNKIRYGKLLDASDFPTISGSQDDSNVVWVNDDNDIWEIFNVGSMFTLATPREGCVITLQATWGMQRFPVTVNVVGESDDTLDNFNSLTVDWESFGKNEIKDGKITFSLEIFTQSVKRFIFDLKEGYEVGEVKFGEEVTNKYDKTGTSIITFHDFKDVSEITIKIIARRFKITVTPSDKNYYKFKNGNEFEIAYDSSVSEAMTQLSITRSGYTVTELLLNGVRFATFENDSFTFVQNFDGYVVNGIWKGLNDITLSIVWSVADDYSTFLNAVTTASEGLIYNGATQTVATTAINIEESFAKNTPLSNGERVKNFYYVGGEASNTEDGYNLLGKDVFSAEVYFVIELEDTLRGNALHKIQTEAVSASISKTKIRISDAVLESYYTGSNVYVDTGNKTNLGSVVYETTQEPNQELQVDHIELYGDSAYNISETGYTVKYYLRNNSAVGVFKATNYDGVVQEKDGTIYYITEEQGLKAKVVQAIVTFHFKEKGFENGEFQFVGLDRITDSRTDFTGEKDGFFVYDISIKTLQATANTYRGTNNFIIDAKVSKGKVSNGGQVVTGNFKFETDGEYEIMSQGEAYRIETAVKYFNITEFTDKEDHYLVLESFTYAGDETTVEGGNKNFLNEETLILSVFGNGEKGLYILVNKELASSIELKFRMEGSLQILSWTEFSADSEFVTTQREKLEGLKTPVENNPYPVSSKATYVAIVTDYKAVKLSMGDLTGYAKKMGYVYVKLGASLTLQDPEKPDSFSFHSWQKESEDEQLSISGKELSARADGDILASMITAIWTIDEPEATILNITEKALPDLKATYTKKISEVIEGGEPSNKHALLGYKYEILRNSIVISNGDTLEGTFAFLANTDTNDYNFELRITASMGGRSQAKTFPLGIEIQTITIESFTIVDTSSFVYHNEDFLPKINVTFTGGVEKTEALSDLIDRTGAPSDLILTERAYYLSGATEIKQANTYVYRLETSTKIFNQATVLTQEVVVNKAEVTITMEDIPDELERKIFGTDDPIFEFTKTMFKDEFSEVVTVTLVRAEGERTGQKYLFTSGTAVGTTPGENFFVNTNGTFFTIDQAEKLKIVIDNELSFIYAKTGLTFELNYNISQNKWILSLGTTSSSLTLYAVTTDSGEVKLSGNVYKNALDERVSFTAPNAITVGDYTGRDEGKEIIANGEKNYKEIIVEGTIRIVPFKLNILSVEKFFDRNATIWPSDSKFEKVFEGDEVYITGEYSQIEADQNIPLVGMALSGVDAFNYTFDECLGTIKPAPINDIVTFDIVNHEFVYGRISKNLSWQDFLSKDYANGYNFAIGDIKDDIEKGYISIDSISLLEDTEVSNAGMLNVGEQMSIIFHLSTTNFIGFEGEFTVKVKITPFKLNLQTLSKDLVKKYDENTSIAPTLLFKNEKDNIDAFLFKDDVTGKVDLVSINKDAGGFDSPEVGPRTVKLVLQGRDSGNYEVIDNVTGTISDYTITFIVKSEEIGEEFVTDGKFVDDGLHPTGETSFSITYPFKSNSEVIDSLTYPKRTGYKAKGWKYQTAEGGYKELIADDLVTICKGLIAENPDEPSMSIYTVWEIDKYLITIIGDDYLVLPNQLTATPNDALIVEDGKQYIKYFSDLEIVLTATRGYKIDSYNLVNSKVGAQDLSDTKKRVSTVNLMKIGSNLELYVYFKEINITFNIDPSIPEYTQRTDANDLSIDEYTYLDTETLTQSDLPQVTVTEGTYKFVGYSYSKGPMGDKTLQAIIDELFEGDNLNEDVKISLTANWQGEEYIISFNATEGEIAGKNTIDAVYGEELGAFPQATLVGKTPVWQDPEGRTYEEGNILQSISTTKDASGKYTLEFTAKWVNAPFRIKVLFDERLTPTVNGYLLTENAQFPESYEYTPIYDDDEPEKFIGGEFTLIYNTTRLELRFEINQGYNLKYDESTVKGEFRSTDSYITIQNLFEDCQISFYTEARDNTLRFYGENFEDDVKVTVDEEPVEVVNKSVVVKTGKTAIFTFTATKGYQFEMDDVVTALGSGTVSLEITGENDNTLILTWSGFTTDEAITITPSPAKVVITIESVIGRFMTLIINHNDINLEGDQITARAGDTLEITGTIAYGYFDGSVRTSIDASVEDVQNSYSLEDGYYHFSARISQFKENFTITFETKVRHYTFRLAVAEGQEELGQITSQEVQTVDFGKELVLQQKALNNYYEIAAWSIGETPISDKENENYVISSALRDILEGIKDNEEILVVASYKRKIRTIHIKVGENATLIATQEGVEGELEIVDEGSGEYFLGVPLILQLNLIEGYELHYVLLDDNREEEGDTTYTYDREQSRLSVVLALENEISSIELVIKAKDVDVVVRAGTYIKYQYYPNSLAGGGIYLVDQDGTRLGDDQYLENEGNVTIGANYKVHSYTNATIYFLMIEQEGFTASISLSEGLVVSNFTTENGLVYAISGIREGAKIDARFVADENDVKLLFVIGEGEDEKVVQAGIFDVHYNEYVSANPNRGDAVTVTVITGEQLVADIRILPAYSFATNELGEIVYSITYQGETVYKNIKTSNIERLDVTQVGYEQSSSITIPQVITSATVKIRVVPKQFKIKLIIDENTPPVELEDKIIYGEEWSLDNLTPAQKAIVYAEKKDQTFNGFWTEQFGSGDQYIDRYYEVTHKWLNYGYKKIGSTYQKEENFDGIDTFTLWASYIADVTSLTIQVVPSILYETVAYNINSYATLDSTNSWVGQEDPWTASVIVGTKVTFTAPEIEGYVFGEFMVQVNGAITHHKTSFTIDRLEKNEYIVTAVYKPEFVITILNKNNDKADGGRSFVRQDGGEVSGSFESGKAVTIVALPNEGYNFLYWYVLDSRDQVLTGNETTITGEKSTNGEYIYTYENLDKPIYLVAVFEGKSINVTFRAANLGEHHQIVEAKLYSGNINNQSSTDVNYNAVFKALVGDTFVIKVRKAKGYGFEANMFSEQYDEQNDVYIFTYTFATAELTAESDNSSYRITLSISESKDKVTFAFDLSLKDAIDQNEVNKSSSIMIIDATGKTTKIVDEATYVTNYGDSFTIKIVANTNYQFSKARLYSNGISHTLEVNDNGEIKISEQLLNNWFEGYTLEISIEFVRLVWTDELIISNVIDGEGTKDSPYIIRTVRDFAFVAFKVNNGLTNENEIKYADLYYKVESNINFEGRYWEPIGTAENPFNGHFNLGSYEFRNVSHYKNYTNPNTSYSGLFWHITKNAVIEQSYKTFTTMIIIICVIFFLLILFIIILFIVKKKRKDKIQELANQ